MLDAEKLGMKDGARARPLPFNFNRAAILAPMSGVTDAGMRRIAAQFGAAWTVTEMVACERFVEGDAEAALRAESAGQGPFVVQLVGREPDAFVKAARLALANGADVIDINMGCPARRVATGLAGSALMQDVELAVRIVASVAEAVPVPVTVKMRLGWDDASRNAPELAWRLEAVGAAMISVHGRTRMQFYKGFADWGAVRGVVDAVRVPVAVNGDCASLADAKAMLAASGAQAVMIGRAAIGAPWLVGAIDAALKTSAPFALPSREAQHEAALQHLDSLLTDLGAAAGLRHARKHLSAYAANAGASADSRRALVTSDNAANVVAALAKIFEPQQARLAA